jgi:hypothetical protein
VLGAQQKIPKRSGAIASSTHCSVITELEMEEKRDDDFELVHRKVTRSRDSIYVQPIAGQIYDSGEAAASVSSSHSTKTTHPGNKSKTVPSMANGVISTRGKNKASPDDNNSSGRRSAKELAQSSVSYPTRSKKVRR